MLKQLGIGGEIVNIVLDKRSKPLLSEQIQAGLFTAGEQLPSVRHLFTQFGVSVLTVLQGYKKLD